MGVERPFQLPLASFLLFHLVAGGPLVVDDGNAARTLLWDLDPQGAATFCLDLKPKLKGGASKLFRGGRDGLAGVSKLTTIDGLEVVRRLRKDRPGLAAFLITGYSDPSLTARAADLGIVACTSARAA